MTNNVQLYDRLSFSPLRSVNLQLLHPDQTLITKSTFLALSVPQLKPPLYNKIFQKLLK